MLSTKRAGQASAAVCALLLACTAAGQQTGAGTASIPSTAPETSRQAAKPSDSVFLRLDKNHDRVIDEAERSSPDAAPYADYLKRADRDENGRVSQEEFRRGDEIPLHRNPHSAAAAFLILAFGCFCMFLDGLLEPERRDYFLWSIAGTLLFSALAYWFAADWFLVDAPYLVYAAVVPALVIITAVLAGATKEIELPEVGATGPVVYKVGKEPAAGAAGAPAAAKPPRKSGPPVRTPRPAPMPRPPVPERRPSPPPRTQTPRPQPPKPPGPPGPKPPPAKP